MTYFSIKKIKLFKSNNKTLFNDHNIENQINDRGWNYGFNKYFPDVETKGYRGLIPSDLLLSEMYPTEDENINGMLPKKICVIGPSLKDQIKKYIKNVDIEVAPAFRFQHIWEKKYLPSEDHYVIFQMLLADFSLSAHFQVKDLLLQTVRHLLS